MTDQKAKVAHHLIRCIPFIFMTTVHQERRPTPNPKFIIYSPPTNPLTSTWTPILWSYQWPQTNKPIKRYPHLSIYPIHRTKSQSWHPLFITNIPIVKSVHPRHHHSTHHQSYSIIPDHSSLHPNQCHRPIVYSDHWNRSPLGSLFPEGEACLCLRSPNGRVRGWLFEMWIVIVIEIEIEIEIGGLRSLVWRVVRRVYVCSTVLISEGSMRILWYQKPVLQKSYK